MMTTAAEAIQTVGLPKLQLFVVYTTVEGTRSALYAAAQMAHDLSARIVLLVAQVVPFPLPLDGPNIPCEFTANALSHLAAGEFADVSVRVFLCRDREQTICNELAPGSLVVLGCGKHSWPNRAPRLARMLKRRGYEVVLTPLIL
jgi:hypothetical protein